MKHADKLPRCTNLRPDDDIKAAIAALCSAQEIYYLASLQPGIQWAITVRASSGSCNPQALLI
jgi:hypothetical protein